MAQKKKSKAAAPAAKRKSSGASGKKASWQGSAAEGRGKLLGIIAVVGIVAILAGYFLQDSSIVALNTGSAAAEANTVQLSELMSENLSTIITGNGELPDWIEITNTGDQPVEIGNYMLMLQSDINKVYSFPKHSLQPGEYLVVYAGGMRSAGSRDPWNAPFKLAASGADTLLLLDAQGRGLDSVALPELGADASYSRMEDGSWAVTGATPGEANRSTTAEEGAKAGVRVVPDVLEITEVMASNSLYFADETGVRHDYVEIHNRSGENVNLQGWFLSDSSDKLRRWDFPEIILPAGGYLAVHCSGSDRTDDPAHLHTDFKISSKGETVYLSRPDGQTVSMAELPVMNSDQAYSLVDGAWSIELAPTPGMENTPAAAAQMHRMTFGDVAGGVYISEIMASPSKQKFDWVEIYNGTGQAVDLSNYGLSDDPDKPRRWQFPQGTTIQPGEYMGVYLSGTGQTTIEGFLNADFALAAEGGYTVTLCGPDGGVFDAAYLPKQYGGISYGRVNGDNGFYFFEEGTPGMVNSGSRYRSRAETARVSVEGGLFRTGDVFTVELSAPEGSRIYYTLDCTEPDEGSMLYSGPITVSGTTIIRSRVYRSDYMPSFIDTQSYLYDVQNEGAVYVVSLVSDPDNLFSDERGIMIKGPNALEKYPYGSMNRGANFWMDWEREAHVEVFEPDGDTAISQSCGIKLHGQYSRACAVKAFKVFARSEYGNNRFEYPIFSDRNYPEYQSFLLRASGQDWNRTFMRDSVLTSLAKDTSVMYQESEVGVCYINGMYYSLFNLRERVSVHSVCQFEGWVGMEDDIDLVKANDNVKQGSNASFDELMTWIDTHDTTTPEAYEYIASHIDIQNYIEYMAIQIFVGNGDTLNVKRYRNPLEDGKWRWVLFDLDWAFDVDTNSIRRWLDPAGMGTNKYTDTTLFIGLMKNPIFFDQFMTYFGQQLATTFSTQNVLTLFEEQYAVIDGLLPPYLEQWGITDSEWKTEMKELYDYAETRPTKIIGYFQETFNFSTAQMEKYFGPAVTEIRRYEQSKEAAS